MNIKKHRVQKLLSNYGYCSRRKAEELIKAGKVKVNNKLITIGDQATEIDKIYVNNKLVSKQKKIYLMFNKPFGCVTALRDRKYKTIMHYVRLKQRVFPVGRLDYNTEGLLLLTNDGDFANNIMHPRYEINKTYLVKINKSITKQQIHEIGRGIKLKDGKTSPAKLKKLEDNLLTITIHEGKKRIVRRIFYQMGLKVLALRRIQIGKLDLGDIKPGEYRKLTEKDKEKIFS